MEDVEDFEAVWEKAKEVFEIAIQIRAKYGTKYRSMDTLMLRASREFDAGDINGFLETMYWFMRSLMDTPAWDSDDLVLRFRSSLAELESMPLPIEDEEIWLRTSKRVSNLFYAL